MEEQLIEFIAEQYLYLIPALWVVGAVLKRTPAVQDWWIPWVLLALGVGAAVGIDGFLVDTIAHGVMVAGVAVFAHQLLIQTRKH